MRIPTVIAACLLSLICLRAPVLAGPLRVALLAETTVQGDTVFLAQFLPADAPANLRRLAERVSLGKAPEIGSARAFSRESLVASLEDAGLPVAQFVLPEIIVVRRSSVLAGRETVWKAMQAAAAARGLALPEDSCQGGVVWAAPLLLPGDQLRMEVRDIHFDKLLNQARFRLRPADRPNAPAISAWCELPPQFRWSLPVASSARLAPHAPRNPASGNLVVRAGRSATLRLHSENSLATLVVRPLQSGQLGQIIRARVPANGHTLLVRITGLNLLEASF